MGNGISPSGHAGAPLAQATPLQQAIDVLQRDFARFDTAAHGGSADGILSRNDLEAIRDDASGTPEQRAAAAYLLDHEDAYDTLDTAAKGGDADGSISAQDVAAAHNDTPQARAQALRTLNDDFATFDTAGEGGKADGIVSRDDLEAVRDGAGYSAAQRQAAAFLLGHGGRFDALDNAARAGEGGSPDGKISREDVDTAYAAPLPASRQPILGSTQVNGSDQPTIVHVQGIPPAGADWGNAANRTGTVAVYVDGKYYADATLPAENGGAADVNVGVLGPGPHTIEVRDSTAGAASGGGHRVGSASVSETTVAPQGRATTPRDATLAARYAPVVHLRNDGQAGNNTPLLTGARVTHNPDGTTTIEYSVVYSNEDDGYGANPASLSDNYGRNTDDEHAYAITLDKDGTPIDFTSSGNRLGSAHGAADVQALLAAHSRDGRPELTIRNGHNQYQWSSDDPARGSQRVFSGAPVVVDGNASAVDIMDTQPWVWKVSNKEAVREGEIGEVQPYQRLYLSRGSANLSDVRRIDVTLRDGSHPTVYLSAPPFIGTTLPGNDAVSFVLRDAATGKPIDPGEVVSVQVLDGGGKPLAVTAQRLAPNDVPVHLQVN